MPQIKIEAVARQPRTFGNETFWGVMIGKDQWVNLYIGWEPKKGDVFDVDITERHFQDKAGNTRTARDARLRQPPSPRPVARPAVPAQAAQKAANSQNASIGGGVGSSPNQQDVLDAACYYLNGLSLTPKDLTEPQASLVCTLIIATFGRDHAVTWDRSLMPPTAEMFDSGGPVPFPDEHEGWPDDHEWPEAVSK